MGLNNIYKTLFDLRILHRYFLDEGVDAYTETGGSAVLRKRLDHNRLTYNLQDIMKIVPTANTRKVLKNYQAIFQQYKDGIRVSMNRKPRVDESQTSNEPFYPMIDFDSNLVLDFTIEIIDPYFFNYTDIAMNSGKDLLYLSNKNPVAYTPPTEKHPDPVTVKFSRITQYSTETGGSEININLLDKITPAELNNKFGIIRIYLTGETGEFTLNDSPDTAAFNDTPQEYDMFLKNRKTYWRFLQADGVTAVYTANSTQPLTKNGYIKTPNGGGNQTAYPNPDGKLITFDKTDNKIYSDVFI